MFFSLLETVSPARLGGVFAVQWSWSLFVLPSNVPLIADGFPLFGSKSRWPEGPHQNQYPPLCSLRPREGRALRVWGQGKCPFIALLEAGGARLCSAFFFFFVKGDNATQAHALLYSTGRVLLLNQYVKVWPGAGGGKLSHRRWWWMGHQADTDIAVTSQAHRWGHQPPWTARVFLLWA